MQNMAISKPPQLPPPPQSTIVTPSPRQYPSMGIQLHSPFPMYPLLYQTPFPQGISYIMDHANSAAPSNTTSTGSYPVISPLYPQLSPFLHLPGPGEYNQSRTHHYNYSRADSRRQNAARVSRSPYYNAASHHNHVDVSRIRDGIDVRTTVNLPTETARDETDRVQIMLRNIPNKVDQAMLKRIVDESSWGKYDFMYLRIDFANDCK